VHRPTYRRSWQRFVSRQSAPEGLSQAAVSQVLALHLWESGERAETDTDLPRTLRHRVRRALSGEKLTGETLTWFIDAFGMSDEDRQRLWRAFAGGSKIDGGIVDTIEKPRGLARPQMHRTVTLFERYNFDATGSLVSRHTMHVIRAAEADIECYLFNHEPFAERVEVLMGGSLGRRYHYGGGLVSDEIVLERPLSRHNTISMEYLTYYPPAWRPTEVRRAVRGRCENVDMAVLFGTEHRPVRIDFCAWADHYDGVPVLREQVEPDDRGYAHWFVPFAEQTVLGFEWQWATAEAATPSAPAETVCETHVEVLESDHDLTDAI